MNRLRFAQRSLLTLAIYLMAATAVAQTTPAQGTFVPEVGQAGKDVVWVPSPQMLVDRMLDMAKVTPQDYVIDLGSGDGRTVITAAKRGVRALGVEYNPDMVELSKRTAAAEGVGDRATFVQADLFTTDLSQANVITMFLLSSINLQLRPKLLDLKPGIRIVSNTFTMGEWEPDDTVTLTDPCSNWCKAMLWIVPAKVAGTWRAPQGNLTLTQEFQMIAGSLGSTPIAGGKLSGDQISFTAGGVQYRGRVNGNSIQGTAPSAWTATRN